MPVTAGITHNTEGGCMEKEGLEQMVVKMDAELIALRALVIVTSDLLATTTPGMRQGFIGGLEVAAQLALSDASLAERGVGFSLELNNAFERLLDAFRKLG